MQTCYCCSGIGHVYYNPWTGVEVYCACCNRKGTHLIIDKPHDDAQEAICMEERKKWVPSVNAIIAAGKAAREAREAKP
jgi:hypothetical protein